MASKNSNIFKLEKKRIDLMKKQFPQVKQRFFVTESKELLAAIVARTPVDTGRLRAAWRSAPVRFDGGIWVISCSNSVEYAKYVEFGHRWIRGSHSFKRLEDFNPETDKAGFTNGVFMAYHGVEERKKDINSRWKNYVSSWLKLYGDHK